MCLVLSQRDLEQALPLLLLGIDDTKFQKIVDGSLLVPRWMHFPQMIVQFQEACDPCRIRDEASRSDVFWAGENAQEVSWRQLIPSVIWNPKIDPVLHSFDTSSILHLHFSPFLEEGGSVVRRTAHELLYLVACFQHDSLCSPYSHSARDISILLFVRDPCQYANQTVTMNVRSYPPQRHIEVGEKLPGR